MSNSYPTGSPYEVDSAAGTGSGTAGVAKDQAAQVGHEAAAAGQKVAGVAKDEAANLASEAKGQAKNLLSQTSGELKSQVGTQKDRLSSGLLSVSSELKGFASGEKADEPGIASDLVQQLSSRVESVATWISDREPKEILDEVTDFARRKPGTFIAVAALAGVLAGRLTRSIVSEVKDEKEAAATPALSAYSATPTYDSVVPTTSFVEPTVTPAYYSDSSDALGAESGVVGGYGTTTAYDAPVLPPTTSTDPYLENPRP